MDYLINNGNLSELEFTQQIIERTRLKAKVIIDPRVEAGIDMIRG